MKQNQRLKKIGLSLTSLRLAKGLSQLEVAKKLGVTRTLINKYEIGRVNIPSNRVAQLAKYFKVSIQQLFDGIDLVAVPRKGACDNE